MPRIGSAKKCRRALRYVVVRSAVWRRGFYRWLSGFRRLPHGIAEVADAVAEALAEFRQFLGPEHEQGNSENHEQVGRLKESFHIILWSYCSACCGPPPG